MRCDAISDYANLIVNNKSYLDENGHSKWKTVDFADSPPGWEYGSCVARGLKADYQVKGCTSQTPEPLETSVNDQVLNFLKSR